MQRSLRYACEGALHLRLALLSLFWARSSEATLTFLSDPMAFLLIEGSKTGKVTVPPRLHTRRWATHRLTCNSWRKSWRVLVIVSKPCNQYHADVAKPNVTQSHQIRKCGHPELLAIYG